MSGERTASRTTALWCAMLGSIASALLVACAAEMRPAISARASNSLRAAFVTLGPGGIAVARVITTSPGCPDVEADNARITMRVRAPPATLPPRPTVNPPRDTKASDFPITICEAVLPIDARRASVEAHALAAPKPEAKRVVVIGDSGCRLKGSDGVFQSCNSPSEWPFEQVARAAAATQPDLVVHVGDYHYRETPCSAGDAGCSGSPWGYGWDAWDADFFTPAQALLTAAPWIFVRGNHESCDRAGQGWWRLLDPRPLVPGRDCNEAANDSIGDYSEPYAVRIAADTKLVVFDSSKVGIGALADTDPMYRIYSAQMLQAFALARDAAHNFFIAHHPILGFAPNPTTRPTGLYPGNSALQSVLAPINPESYFPAGVDLLLAGHNHLFEMVSFATSQPVQLISGNGGAWADARLPIAMARTAQPAPGAAVASIVSTSEYGFMLMERGEDDTWRIEARDRRGHALTACTLRGAKARCEPETLP